MSIKRKLMKQTSQILFLLTLLAVSATSQAHTDLTRISPANNAMLMSLPDAIELEFNGKVNLIKLELINRMSKEPVDIAFKATAKADSSFRVELPVLEVGTYLINWSILGGDGHQISGSAGFMLHSDGVNVMDMSQSMPMDGEKHSHH